MIGYEFFFWLLVSDVVYAFVTHSGVLYYDVFVVFGLGWFYVVLFLFDGIEVLMIDLFGFLELLVVGYGGMFCLFDFNGCRVLLVFGRVYFYEGYLLVIVVYGVRMVVVVGCRVVVFMNVVGSLY